MAKGQGQGQDGGQADGRRFLPPMILCFALGLTFAVAVLVFDSPGPPPSLAGLWPGADAASAAAFAAPGAVLAKIGGAMAYRGYAALTSGIALAVIVTSIAAIRLFVPSGRTRKVIFWVLAGEVAVGVAANMLHGSGMSAAARAMRCEPAAPAPSWDMCSVERIASFPLPFHYGFNAMVDALCTAATAAVIFATFIVASAGPRRGLPAIVGSVERGVTILLVAASALLVSVTILDKSFLQWTFADFLALEKPPGDVTAYIAGMSVLSGGLETALLAGTWFISVLLIGRSGAPSGADRLSGGFSAYNLSAIFAPVLSSVAANLLAGQ